MSEATGPARPRLTLLVNPASGHGRARKKLPGVLDRLGTARPDADVVVRLSHDYADAAAQAADAVASARPGSGDALVVMGGDGMASIGLNACATSGVPLGVLPAGTGNDFCRGAGLPTKLDAAVDIVAAGHTRRIDLMRVSGALYGGAEECWVGSILSTGFDEKVNWRANHFPVSLGAPAYIAAVMVELRRFKPLRYRLRLDGQERELDAILVAVGNAGVFGGGIRICPDADVTDGLLDITIVHPVSPRLIFQLLPKLFTGDFAQHPAIETLRATIVDVDGDGLFGMADGEDLGRPPFRCRVVPRALQLFSP